MNILRRLNRESAEHVLGVVLANLPMLTRNCQPQHQNTLNIIWPTADDILAHASPQLLVHFASKLLPHLVVKKTLDTDHEPSVGAEKDSCEVTPVLASKFGISVIVGLLVRGEQVYSEMIQHEEWQEFLSRVIALLANIHNPNLITDTLVRDSGSGDTASCSSRPSTGPSMVVLGRGQSLSSLTKQRLLAAETLGNNLGRLTPPLPLTAVSGVCISKQPGVHLARCTEQMHSDTLAAAQSTLQRLELNPNTIGGVEVVTITATPTASASNKQQPQATNQMNLGSVPVL